MSKKSGKVYVVGHKNPDTDSICSAIAYAYLKKQVTGEEYVARRAGLINEETAYVLNRFGVDAPPLLQNVKLQVKDIDIHKIDGVDPQLSIKDTWEKMKENNVKTIPVLKDEELVGVISTGDIATSYMDVYDNRVASCLVICQNAEVPDELIKKAEEQSIVIIRTPHDTFTAARLINQSIPVKYFMTKMPLTTFQLTDYVDDIKDVMTKKKFRDFPILDRHGRFRGFISRRRFLDVSKKKVILVDHNEKSQAVDGIEEAEIVEIVDHHRLGNIETVGPVFFRNQPVGCTATIIYQMYQEAGVKISKTIAGLLCSAIISDTLLFRSPTCTPVDEKTAKKLARIAEIDLEQLAGEMFRAGSNLQGKSAEEICFQDFKQFTVNDVVFGVGQINSMNKEELAEIREKLTPHLPKVLKAHNLQMIYFMLTDILDESTELLCCGAGARERVLEAFDLREDTDPIILKGVVSRKKQLIPTLVSFMQQ